MEKRIEDDEIWIGCLSLNEHGDDLVFKEKLDDAISAISCIADDDEDEALMLLMHAVVFQTAFRYADEDPDTWLPKMNETITDLARMHYTAEKRRDHSRPTFFSFLKLPL